MNAFTGALAGSALAVAAGAALAQEESTNRVAVETAWSVFVEDDPKECWSVSSPTNTVNTRDGEVVSVTRGDILLFVTFRPGSDVAGEVSFTGGYPFAEESTVELDVGGTEYELFTEGEWAWPQSAESDAEIVAALRDGTDARLTARSSRGTNTEDTFSLIGFTAALEEAQERCSG
jgi:invasion protein IalB